MTNDDEIAQQYDREFEAGTALNNLKPVRARVPRNAESIYSLRFTSEEMSKLSAAAEAARERLSRFIRTAALDRADDKQEKSPSSSHTDQLLRDQNMLLKEQNALLREQILLAHSGASQQLARREVVSTVEVTRTEVTEFYGAEVAQPVKFATTNALSAPNDKSYDFWSDIEAALGHSNEAVPQKETTNG